MKCGVNQPDSSAAGEVLSALDSIMPFSTLACFLSLSTEDKKKQLEVDYIIHTSY